MAVDRLTPSSTSPPPVPGDPYMDSVAEEVRALWDTASVIRLGAVSGTNTITATVSPPLLAGLVDGMNFVLRAVATNTGPVTLNGNPVVDGEGNALGAGAIRIGGLYPLTWVAALSKYCIVGYFPAAAVPVGSKLISRVLLTANRASIDFVHGLVPTDGVGTVLLDGTYDSYTLKITKATPTTDDSEAWFRIGTGGGPTYQTAGYSSYVRRQASATEAVVINTALGQILMSGGSGTLDVGNASGEDFSATINFAHPNDATNFFRMYGQAAYGAAVGGASMLAGTVFTGGYNTQGAITAIRFQFDAGNVGIGSAAALYGVANS